MNNINQLDLTDVYSTFTLITAEYMLLSGVYETRPYSDHPPELQVHRRAETGSAWCTEPDIVGCSINVQ